MFMFGSRTSRVASELARLSAKFERDPVKAMRAELEGRGTDAQRERLEGELFQLVSTEPRTKAVLAQFGCNIEDVKTVYNKAMSFGCGPSAAKAIADPASLSLLLSANKQEDHYMFDAVAKIIEKHG